FRSIVVYDRTIRSHLIQAFVTANPYIAKSIDQACTRADDVFAEERDGIQCLCTRMHRINPTRPGMHPDAVCRNWSQLDDIFVRKRQRHRYETIGSPIVAQQPLFKSSRPNSAVMIFCKGVLEQVCSIQFV